MVSELASLAGYDHMPPPDIIEGEPPETQRVVARKRQLEQLGFSFEPSERLLDLQDIAERQSTLYRPAILLPPKFNNVGKLGSIERKEEVRMEIGEQVVIDTSKDKGGAPGPAAEIKGGSRDQKLSTTVRTAQGRLVEQHEPIWTYKTIQLRDNADDRITEKHRKLEGLRYHGEVASLYGPDEKLVEVVVTVPIPGTTTAKKEIEYKVENGEFIKKEERLVDFNGFPISEGFIV